MMNDVSETTSATTASGVRGPAEHAIREQIVTAANAHFSHYGYGKTTVADLAKAIGFSKAYIYKFFDSKQAIGEAICTQCLGTVMRAVTEAVEGGTSATEKFRRLFRTIVQMSVDMFFADRKLYDIAAYSCSENWQSSARYLDDIADLLRAIILEGRDTGEFERKTPLDETVRAILQVMQPFTNPMMLQYNLDLVPDAPVEVASLVLRSLAP